MSFARNATAPRASSLSCTRRGSAGARRELNTTTAQKQNSRDGHDGNAKCQCCAQAKRQHVEVLRGMGGPVCTLGQNHWGNWRRQGHKGITPVRRAGHRRREGKIQAVGRAHDMEDHTGPESLSKSKTVTKMYGSHLRSRRRARQITIRGHLLRQLGGRAIASKRRQAHARVAHCNGCLTGAVTAAPSVGEPAHHPLDQIGFYGFGQHLKLAVCEKCYNPKNSKNTCTDATTADDCGVMSLGHSL